MSKRSGLPNSDELGEKGQSRFRELCADAKLVCNSSDRDLAGWDFIVEFPFQKVAAFSSLDKRGAPISCHVQVKTMWNTNDRFKLRLSSAERLAKEVKPSFVYVLKVDDELNFTAAYLIHVLDDPLAAILKRLRQKEANAADLPINKIFISMGAEANGKELRPTGADLKAALVEACGQDPHSYIRKKQTQIVELGFDSQAFEMTATFHAATKEEYLEAFLGLRSVQISDFQSFDRRFGIKLPITPSDVSGTIEIKPQPDDQCMVTFVKSDVEKHKPIVFLGELYFLKPPIAQPGDRELLVTTESFRLRISLDGSMTRGKFIVDGKQFEQGKLTPSKWRNLFDVGNGVAKGVGTFQIQPRNLAGPIVLDIRTPSLGIDSKDFAQISRLCGTLGDIFNKMGLEEPNVAIADITAAASHIVVLNAILSGRPENIGKFQFGTDIPENAREIGGTSIVALLNYLEIGETVIGYAIVADVASTVLEDVMLWKSTTLRSVDYQLLFNGVAAFDDYAERTRQSSGAVGVIKRDQLMKFPAADISGA